MSDIAPKVVDGFVMLTEEQYRLLKVTAAQADYGVTEGDWDCLDAAQTNAALALKAIGEKTREQEIAEEEAADAALDAEEEEED